MAAYIDLPGQLSGRPEEQLLTLYNYLYKTAEAINVNLQEIGPATLTDEEQELMNQLTVRKDNTQTDQIIPAGYETREQETLKSMIIKVAEYVRDRMKELQLVLYGEEEGTSENGAWRRAKGLSVDITPDGINQTYTYAEIVKGLKNYEINTKSYIKSGYLHDDDQDQPVYGVAIGQGVVEFDDDGTETYNDENKVAELTADGLSFYCNNTLLATYTGERTTFYSDGDEVMYIEGGDIYATNDLKIMTGTSGRYWKYDDKGLTLFVPDDVPRMQIGDDADRREDVDAGITAGFYTQQGVYQSAYLRFFIRATRYGSGELLFNDHDLQSTRLIPAEDEGVMLGGINKRFGIAYIKTIYCTACNQSSSRDIKHNIQPMPEMGDRLDQLRPVTFVYDEDKDERTRHGLIYEDTIGVMPEICTLDEGEKAINYIELVPMLLKEIQDLRARVAELERRE